MRSLIEQPGSSDPPSEYLPPWARDRVGPAMPVADRLRDRSLTNADFSSDGNRGVLELRDRLTLEPDQVPEVARDDATGFWLIALPACGIAALGACAIVALLTPHQTAHEMVQRQASARPIAQAGTGLVQSQPQTAVPPRVEDDAAGPHELSPSASASIKPEQTPETVARVPSVKDAVVAAPATAPLRAAVRLPANNPSSQTEIASASSPKSMPSQPVNKAMVLSTDEIATLIRRGKDFITTGDFESARLLLRRAAAIGSAEAALALGTTFDPLVIGKLGAIGIQPDIDQARQWYQRAAELGSAAASRQLANLAARHSRSPHSAKSHRTDLVPSDFRL